MSGDNLKLLLTALEAEVVEEALELYVRLRPAPHDDRFEYRYRAVRSVLASLRQGNRELGTFARGDDEEVTLAEGERSERRPFRDQVED